MALPHHLVSYNKWDVDAQSKRNGLNDNDDDSDDEAEKNLSVHLLSLSQRVVLHYVFDYGYNVYGVWCMGAMEFHSIFRSNL